MTKYRNNTKTDKTRARRGESANSLTHRTRRTVTDKKKHRHLQTGSHVTTTQLDFLDMTWSRWGCNTAAVGKAAQVCQVCPNCFYYPCMLGHMCFRQMHVQIVCVTKCTRPSVIEMGCQRAAGIQCTQYTWFQSHNQYCSFTASTSPAGSQVCQLLTKFGKAQSTHTQNCQVGTVVYVPMEFETSCLMLVPVSIPHPPPSLL